MKVFDITGSSAMFGSLIRAQSLWGQKLARGLAKAGLFLQRESQLVVPVQTGNLKNSAFTRRFGVGVFTDVVVGYTALYAAYVHEIPNPPHAHGREFNVKHAAEIAHAGSVVTSKSGRSRWKPNLKKGTAAGGMFPRGENQQFKYLEGPARQHRADLLRIISSEIGTARP